MSKRGELGRVWLADENQQVTELDLSSVLRRARRRLRYRIALFGAALVAFAALAVFAGMSAHGALRAGPSPISPGGDTQPPSTPTGLKASAASASEIDLSWSRSSDNVAVVGYVIYRNRTKLTTVSGATTAFKDANVAPSTRYTYTVAATDAAGNSSPRSRPASATTPKPVPG
jgi:hypothetical protein